ncbi:MAG: hypothetical protein HFJ55_03720 [Clostridia bacterium]|nr:hypothetical protein [Clostridia bacterium]
MSRNYQVEVKFTNITKQLAGINAQFLSQLSSKELNSLMNSIVGVEGRIRAELQNVKKRP